jgi:hypothetical protein
MRAARAVGEPGVPTVSDLGSGVKAGLTLVKTKSRVETPEYAAFVTRVIRACGRRVADGDIGGLAYLVALRDEVETTIASAVAGLRSEPWSYSWQQVADELGTTRQAAQQRYGRDQQPGAEE